MWPTALVTHLPPNVLFNMLFSSPGLKKCGYSSSCSLPVSSNQSVYSALTSLPNKVFQSSEELTLTPFFPPYIILGKLLRLPCVKIPRDQQSLKYSSLSLSHGEHIFHYSNV